MTFTARVETYVNVSSLTSPYNFVLNKPSGTVEGDFLYALFMTYKTSAVSVDSVPSGWALIAERTVSTYYHFWLYYKVAGASEPTSYTWSISTTAKLHAVCGCYTGGDFDPADPVDVFSNTQYITSNNICRAASMVVSAANSPLIFFGGVYHTSAKTFTKPSTPTTGWMEDDDAGSVTPDFFSTTCSMIWGGSGATGNIDATLSASDTQKHAFAVALNPPPGGVTEVEESDSITLADSVLKSRYISVSDSLGMSDAAQLGKVLAVQDSVGLADQVSILRSILVGDSIGLQDSASVDKALLILDEVGLNDQVLLGRLMYVEDTVSAQDGVLKTRSFTLEDAVGLQDLVQKARSLSVQDVLSIADFVVKGREMAVSDGVSLEDAALKSRILLVVDSISLADQASTDRQLVASDQVGLLDGVRANKSMVLSDAVVIIDTVIKSVSGEGWTGTILGVVDPAKIMGLEVGKIKKILGVE